MAIRKEKNGTYSVDVSFGSYNGKRIRIRKKGIEKRKDAIKIEAEIVKNHKNTNCSIKENLTFKEIYLKYIDNCNIEVNKGNLRNSTINSKNSIFKYHILPYFEKVKVNTITKNDILRFQKQLYTTKNIRNKKLELSNGTIRKVYKQLHAFFEYCVKEEYISLNPCDRVNNYKKEKKEKEYITLEEYNSLIKYINNKRDLTIVRLLFFTGIRISELLGLSIEKIHLSDTESYLNISNTYYNGELREYAKTDNTQGLRYIDKGTANILIDYINSEEFKSYNTKYLFPSKDAESGIMTAKAVGNMIKKVCKLAYINKNITPHSFRHGHVAMLIDAGMNLEDIKDRVGHKSIRTTSDEYGHMYNSRKKEVVSNIEKYINLHKSDL